MHFSSALIDTSALVAVADAYKRATALEDVTVSYRAFGDSKKLAGLRGAADITVKRFNQAMLWFSANWPEGAEWPAGVPRPLLEAAE